VLGLAAEGEEGRVGAGDCKLLLGVCALTWLENFIGNNMNDE